LAYLSSATGKPVERVILKNYKCLGAILSRIRLDFRITLSRKKKKIFLLHSILYILSAFFHPQNIYCIAVDSSKDIQLLTTLQKLSKCYPNIIVTVHYQFSDKKFLSSCNKF
uniref:DUF2183 domain-containing protein n=1 Tax=Dracunculus medinensis TaxID=318479 RepID=A0A0N4UD10_DRAME